GVSRKARGEIQRPLGRRPRNLGSDAAMLRTRICELLGIELPIISAGMGGVALSNLAGAVSEAGGFGFIGLAGFSPAAIHYEIDVARKITKKPIGVNLLIPFLRPGTVEAVADEPIV